jgi:predicted ATPase
MQLHPDYKKWGKEIELLKNKSLIGLGLTKSDLAYMNFKNDMEIDDIVVIKRGSIPLALVQVVGKCEDIEINSDDRLDWFRYRRKIKILTTDTKGLTSFPQPRKTLQKALNEYTLSYIYIDNWYKNYISKEKKDTGLKLYKVAIDDFKVFHNFEIDFLDENDKPLPLVVIIGKNGTGKTTLFEYIYRDNFFTIGANYANNINYISVVEDGNLKVLNNKAKEKRKKIDRYLEEQKKLHGLAAIAYDENGLYLGDLKENIIYLPAETPRKDDIELLDRLILDYIDYFIYEKDNSASVGYINLQNDMDEIFEDFELNFKFYKIDSKNKKALFKSNSTNNNNFSLTNLSTGEKTLMFKVLKLYLQQTKNKVILIDEPEISLHPSWQNKVIGIYERFAKISNNQIIIATHSPHILASVDNKYIRVLKKDENGHIKAIKDNIHANGRDMNSILFDVMGEVSYRPKEFTDMIDEMYEFIDENKYQDALKIFNFLKENYGENDVVIIEAKISLDMMKA